MARERTESGVIHRTRDLERGGRATSDADASETAENAPLVPEAATGDGDDKKSRKLQLSRQHSKPPPPPPAARPRATILFLNGLRGLASLIVVGQHGDYFSGVNLGAVAVDTFFVLSAFLLTLLFERKARQMVAQRASLRQWLVMLVDYFSKRFFRVYPLFALTAVFVWMLSDDAKQRYFHMAHPEQYNLWEVLTFKFEARYHVFWTLPVEIGYYFLIPVLVAAVIALGRRWWTLTLALYLWILHEGVITFRTSHFPLKPHIPTFLAGSLAAIVYAQVDNWLRTTGFELQQWHRRVLRAYEGIFLALFLSVSFRGLFFHWVHANPVPAAEGFPFVSVPVTIVMVIEMLQPSPLARALEWNFLCYAGQISFSMYLLHSFVIYQPDIMHQNKYDRCFLDFGLSCLVSTATYWLIEHPSQLGAQRVSKWLAQFATPRAGGNASNLCDRACVWKI